MSNDGGKQDTGSDAGWTNVQSNKDFNKDNTWSGKSDDQVKQDIKNREDRRTKEKEFINSGKVNTPFLTLKPLETMLKKGSIKTRTFFTNKVLSKKGVTYKGTKYSKTEFQDLSVSKQNEIYAGYMEGRLSGQTDAYGNVNPNFGKDKDPPKRKTEQQVEDESEQEENKTEDNETEEEKEENYKKAKGLKGSRSMFGNAGGRGYFDPK
ncbi:cation transport ATPase [uncultured Mediterranean phage uvMED]|nr:cation transport ATPase [uncultured Mediterranean phage uvMED]BAR17631.1 cation transport ATPase [uncultured Mediterranean phage uvMED]